MKPEKCRECGAELRLRPATCPLCGCELKPEDSWAPPGDHDTEDSYHSNVRQLRDELKRLRDEARSA